jgi:hypothetical protein
VVNLTVSHPYEDNTMAGTISLYDIYGGSRGEEPSTQVASGDVDFTNSFSFGTTYSWLAIVAILVVMRVAYEMME